MSELTSIKGIGPKMKQKLIRNNIYDCFQLIKRYPSRYEIYQLSSLKDAPEDEKVTLEGIVTSDPKVAYIRKNLTRLSFKMQIEDREFTVSIFNREYLHNILDKDVEIVVTGTIKRNTTSFTATTLKLKKNFENTIEPMYNIDGISDATFQRFALESLKQYGHLMNDSLPKELQKEYKLIDYHTLLQTIHNPKTELDLKQIDRRIKYEELFYFQLKMQYIKLRNKNKKYIKKEYNLNEIKHFIHHLPFELTDDQKQATNEIIKDIKSPYTMNRLLQGDTGSGKTVVAAITILGVLSSNYQVAMMAPTEILARQHHKTMSNYFKNTPYKVLLLTGKITKEERETVKDQINKEKPCLIIGTHALFSDDILYHKLGYVITDEQHRFGVKQRQKLRKKGLNPDVLYMSATPIPRTLAISVFGDMDITTIKERPSHQLPVETKLFHMKQLDMVYLFMEEELRKDHQVFIVTPLILESEQLNLANAQDVFSIIQKRFSDYDVGLIHSKISQEDKEQVMTMYHKKELQILVSTTVIEVGVDVKDATTMIIFNSERFGLSQLHQLRGRVGRSNLQGYCFLLYEQEDAPGRLRIMEETNNGFKLSEEDLKQRGPGEFFGHAQSGITKFQRADLVEDYNIVKVAQKDALDILLNKDNYKNPKYQTLFNLLKNDLKQIKFD